MKQPIIDYHKGEGGHWVAQLACGHDQHVRSYATVGEPPDDRP